MKRIGGPSVLHRHVPSLQSSKWIWRSWKGTSIFILISQYLLFVFMVTKFPFSMCFCIFAYVQTKTHCSILTYIRIMSAHTFRMMGPSVLHLSVHMFLLFKHRTDLKQIWRDCYLRLETTMFCSYTKMPSPAWLQVPLTLSLHANKLGTCFRFPTLFVYQFTSYWEKCVLP